MLNGKIWIVIVGKMGPKYKNKIFNEKIQILNLVSKKKLTEKK